MLRILKNIFREPVNKLKACLRDILRSRLAKKYLRGSGIEIGALHAPLKVSSQAKVQYVDRMPLAELLVHYPHLRKLKVIDPDIVDDGEKLTRVGDDSLDFIVANHFIEHCEDPIGTLKIFTKKLKDDSLLFLSVPDKRYTFDRLRPLTNFDHLVKDHESGVQSSRQEHYHEVAELTHFAGQGQKNEIEEVAKDLMQKNYSIHYHVWDEDTFRDFLQALSKKYNCHFVIVESKRIFEEVVFVLRKRQLA